MMSPELRELIEQANEADRAAGLELPPPEPGGDRTAWLATVAEIRARWDGRVTARSDAQHRDLPVREIRDVAIDSGDAVVAARCYIPTTAGLHAAVILFHGGGFWMAGGEAAFVLGEPVCRLLCAQLGAVVLDVDYRLAPEHKYPAAPDDAYASVIWLHEHAPELNIDRDRVALLGISSGGNLAAVAARRSRERGGPAIRFLALLGPALDLTGEPTSMHQPELVNYGLEAASRDALFRIYLNPDDDPGDPDISPGLDPHLAGMPATFIVVGEHDVLLKQGEGYAERLRAAGVEATAKRYDMSHGVAQPETVAAFTADLVAALAAALAPEAVTDKLSAMPKRPMEI